MELAETPINILLLFLISFLTMLFITIYFYMLGMRARGDNSKRMSSIIPTSCLGLLALILSFSFSMAITRYESRRTFTVAEANAITTSFLRAQLLHKVPGVDINSLYKQYIEERIRFYEEGLSTSRKHKSEIIQKKLWNHYQQVTVKDRGAIESLYGFGLNSMIDANTSRYFSLVKTLPFSIYLIIQLVAFVALAVLNYCRGFEEEKSYWGSVIFALLFSVLFTLIFDIDHSKQGLISISQDSMIDARTFITNFSSPNL